MRKFLGFLLAFASTVALSDEIKTLKTDTFKSKANWVTEYVANGGSVDHVTGYRPDLGGKKTQYVDLKAAKELPASFDWRDKVEGGLQPIKNQGNCGSCWSFSIIATVESLLKIKDAKSTPNLSDQTMVDCSRYDCNGGYFDAFDYMRDKGVPSNADYPYRANNGRCKSMTGMAMQKIKSWSYVGSANKSPTTDQIKTAIMEHGPVSVDVAADSAFMGYKSGIYNRCNRSQINHMTNIVGWNDADGGYWIMRNSWGTKWGEDGYMRIKYTDSSGRKCNYIGDTTAFAVLE